MTNGDCLIGDGVAIGYVTLFVLTNEPVCIRILEHTDHGRSVWDCNDPQGVDEWCVLANGSVDGGECPPSDCPSVPVQNESWGAIKALYR